MNKVVLIAATFKDGLEHLRTGDVPKGAEVIIVTPRSRYGARGVTADAIYTTPAMRAHPSLDDLLEETRPCLLHAAGLARWGGQFPLVLSHRDGTKTCVATTLVAMRGYETKCGGTDCARCLPESNDSEAAR